MKLVSAPAFQYHFTRASRRYPALGAPHAIELRYVFNTFDPATAKKEDRELAAKMMKYWVRFAKTGNPNVEGLPAWPEYDGEKPSCLELGAEIREGVGLGDDICDSLDRFTLRAYLHRQRRRTEKSRETRFSGNSASRPITEDAAGLTESESRKNGVSEGT